MASMVGLFKASGMSVAEVVQATGRSKATVSQVINGKYHGRDEVVEEIRNLLESRIGPSGGGGTECGREAPGEEGPGDERRRGLHVVVPAGFTGGNGAGADGYPPKTLGNDGCEDAPMITPGQKQAWVLMQLVRKQGEFSMLVGASGVGKTYISKKFCAETGADYFRAILGQSVGGLLSDLCKLWGLSPDGANDARMSRLRRAARGRMLVVDEADLLLGNRSRQSVVRLVEVFRQLYEAGAAVVLLGLPVLHTSVSRATETYVFSRIGYFRQVSPPGDDLLGVFWKRLIGGYGRAVEKTGPVVAQARRSGYFRYLEKLSELVRLFDGDVEEALSLMFQPYR